MLPTRFVAVCLAVFGLPAATWKCPAGQMQYLLPKTLPLPEGGASLRACELHTDEGVFFFVPPASWSQQFKAQQNEISYLSPQNDTCIKFSITWTNKGELVPLKSEFLRDYIQTKYPGAKILEEFPCYTCGQAGIGFQLEQTPASTKKTLTRLAFVPFPGGWLEFRLTTATDLFPKRAPAFSTMVSSFRYTPGTNSVPKRTDAK
jgi:hypothetical protein